MPRRLRLSSSSDESDPAPEPPPQRRPRQFDLGPTLSDEELDVNPHAPHQHLPMQLNLRPRPALEEVTMLEYLHECDNRLELLMASDYEHEHARSFFEYALSGLDVADQQIELSVAQYQALRSNRAIQQTRDYDSLIGLVSILKIENFKLWILPRKYSLSKDLGISIEHGVQKVSNHTSCMTSLTAAVGQDTSHSQCTYRRFPQWKGLSSPSSIAITKRSRRQFSTGYRSHDAEYWPNVD